MSDVTLKVKTIVGTGDPFDGILLVPLMSQWGVPNQCIMNVAGVECTEAIRRLYVLTQPFDGHKVIGICEAHHQEYLQRKIDDDDRGTETESPDESR